jgi:hypothetical protein
VTATLVGDILVMASRKPLIWQATDASGVIQRAEPVQSAANALANSRETIDLIGSPPARMAEAQMGVQAGGLSIRPFQVSRWRLRRARLLWVLNGVLLVGYG